MSGYGFHWTPCSGGQSTGVLAAVVIGGVAAFEGAAWLAENIITVLAVSAACGVLTVAAVVWLMRWGNRRDERQRAAASIWTVREVPPITHARAESVTSAERPALGFRNVHIHLDGMAAAEQAQVIRQALNGRNNLS